ncbi:MAG: hypothetical protein K6F95_04215 [Selenomonas sp.]|uniref:HMA2 domain-containing protein n=1 Tax=Selenomonas sp. TaxID=2053611 RepID=UPI0025D78ABE|nr:hypothetical protein [Selenomonas sp.]MCR5757092.1 hypothetical protein [Selenomonas sp.]
MQCDMKNLPLGWPLTVASVGTVATLWAGKNLHAGFGVAWAVLSVLHGWQHHKKMKADVKKLTGCCKKQEEAVKDTFAELVESFQVDAYVPGRVRLRSSLLAVNPQWKAFLEDYIKSFTGVKDAVITPLTGSLLIIYDGEKLKPKMAVLEQRLAAQVANRR